LIIWDYIVCIFSAIPKLIYIISNAFLSVIDLLQLAFRKLAGLDVYFIDGVAQEGDIVYHFIRGTIFGDFPILTNAFWGLIILGFILLFLSTIVAIIRNEYATDKPEDPRSSIIKKAFKSIVLFAIVPISVLFGIFLSNIILQAVDQATSISTSNSFNFLDTQKLKSTTLPGGSSGEVKTTYIHYNLFSIALPTTTTTFSGAVFNSSCYNANRARYDNTFFELLNSDKATHFGGLFQDNDPEKIAGAIDEGFANYVKVETVSDLDYSEWHISKDNLATVDIFTLQGSDNIAALDRNNVKLVWYYYNLWYYNFLVAFAAGITLCVLFVNFSIGLIGRFIELVGLFLIAAPLIALRPLDNGDAYKAWRGKFISKTIMVIGAIGGMNIVFLIMPYLNKLSFFNIDIADSIMSVLFMIVAFMLVKTFIGMISSFIKSEDLNKSGSELSKELGNKVASAGMLAVGGAGLALRGLAVTGKLGAKGLKAFQDVRSKNSLAGRAAQADAANAEFGAEREAYKGKLMQSDAVSKNAEKRIRQSYQQYRNMSDDQFELAKLEEGYQQHLDFEKGQVADNVMKGHSRYGWQMTPQGRQDVYAPKTAADFPAESRRAMLGSWAKQTIPREDLSAMFGEARGLTKEIFAPLSKSDLASGWKDGGGDMKKALIKINMPYISPHFAKQAKDEAFEKQVKEAYAKGVAAAEADRRRQGK